MIASSVAEGFYHSDGWNRDYPQIQILTVEEILAGKQPDLPPNIDTFKKAGKMATQSQEQTSFGFES